MSKPVTTPSFAMLVQRFFTEHLTHHRAVSPRTVAAYSDTFRLLLQFAERHTGKPPTRLKLVDLDAKLVLAFLDHLERDRNNGARSRNARLAAVRSFLKYAAHHDLSALGVIEQTLAVPMKRFDRPMLGFLTRPEMQAIIDAPDTATWAGQRDHALFTMFYNTGARVSEMIDVRVENLILDTSPSIHLTGKGRKQRTVPLWRSTVTVMRAWRRRLGTTAGSVPLFPNRSGGAMSRSNVTQRLALAVKTAAGQHPQLLARSISPHTFRHTTAMHLLQSGVDMSVIALWLGHESPSTTHMYLEADLSMKERALGRLQPPAKSGTRYKPPDQLLQFLQGL
ncbi:MAG: site-specific integrase [Hyphomicrobiaceae bacterium]